MLLILIAFITLVALSLLTDAQLLLWTLPGGLPLGHALVALALLAGAAIPLQVRPGGPTFVALGRTTLALALLWLPLGLLLAGNAELDFVDDGLLALLFHGLTVTTAAAVAAMNGATILLVVRSAIELGDYDE